MKIIGTIYLLLCAFILSACARSSSTTVGPLLIQDPWVRAAQVLSISPANEMDLENETPGEDLQEMSAMSGVNSAAFMVLKNNGKVDDRLVSAKSDVAQAVEIHLSEMKDGVMSMRQVDGVEIPAGGQAELKPGGYHIMLIGIKQNLNLGDVVPLQLTFENAGTVSVLAEVRNP